ncbi:MAG: hypothetical protein JNL67_03950 [Planctomycetaceae bacterium]|nr:hypothetical protein [Planctomycetaceae bacterium]
MNLWKPIAPFLLVICLAGCGEHREELTHLPNGQYRIETFSNGVLTKTRLFDRNGQLVIEDKPDNAE